MMVVAHTHVSVFRAGEGLKNLPPRPLRSATYLANQGLLTSPETRTIRLMLFRPSRTAFRDSHRSVIQLDIHTTLPTLAHLPFFIDSPLSRISVPIDLPSGFAFS